MQQINLNSFLFHDKNNILRRYRCSSRGHHSRTGKSYYGGRGFVYEFKCLLSTNFRSNTKINRVNVSYTDLIRTSL